MATRTFVGASGANWGTVGSWDTGIPTNSDIAVINTTGATPNPFSVATTATTIAAISKVQFNAVSTSLPILAAGGTWTISVPTEVEVTDTVGYARINMGLGVSGSGALNKTGVGLLGSAGTAWGAVPINLNAGAIYYTNNNLLGTGTITMAPGTQLATTGGSGSTFTLANNFVINGDVYLNNLVNFPIARQTMQMNGTVNLGGVSRTLYCGNGTNVVVWNGTVTASAGFVKEASGTLRIAAAQPSMSGDVSVAAGTLDVTHVNGLQAATLAWDGTVGTFTTVTNSNIAAIKSATAGNTLALGASAITVGNPGASATFAAKFTGSALITKAGAGTWTLSGDNSGHSGGFTVSGGTLRGTAAAAFGTGTVTMSGTPTLELSGGNTYTNPINAISTIRNVSGSNTLSGVITVTGTTALESQAGTLSTTNALSGNAALTLSGAGDHAISSTMSFFTSLTKSGAGTSLLSGTANTFTGTPTINAGVLEVKALANSGSNSSIGAGTTIAFGAASTGVLKYSGTSVSATDRALTFNTANNAGFDSSATNAFASMTASGAVTTTGSNTIALKGSNTGYNILSGALSGAQSINKTGAGRWILKGANSLTGTTTVSAGQLVAANAAYANKLLGGDVVVQAGGEIHLSSEGDQKGRCAYTNLTVGGTAGNKAKIRIGGVATSPTVYLNGDLALPTGGDKANWDLTGDTFKTPGTYTLFVFSGSFGVTGGTVASNVNATYPAGRFGVLAYNTGTPNTITVTIS